MHAGCIHESEVDPSASPFILLANHGISYWIMSYAVEAGGLLRLALHLCVA